MVNFFLNMDVSGSAHTDPLLPTFIPEVLAVNIISRNKVKVILGGSKNAKGGVNLSKTKIVVKVGDNTFISNILGTEPYNNDNANFGELDYTFAADHFIATNFASEIHFIIDDISGNELDAALMNIGLPHEHALAANNDYVAGALPDTSTPNFSSAKIIDRNNWRIEIGNPEKLTQVTNWQYIKVELSRTSLGVTTSTTLFDAASGSVNVSNGILEGELLGSVGYFLHGDVLHLTHSEDASHNQYSNKITTTTTTSPFESPKIAIDPDQTKILASVNVEESVFANVFKFRFENQPAKAYFSSSNSDGGFSLTNTDSSMNFWYERDISGSDNTIFIPSLETDKFDDADDWSWQKYVSASETGSNYQPWVHDGNLIADKIFGTQIKNITSDIFKNEDTLISNIKSGYNSVIDVIEDSLKGKTIKVASTNATAADTYIFNKHKKGGGYNINESDHILKENGDIFENVNSDFIVNSKNIPQFLLEQILRENPNRLTDINFTDTQNKQSIPLKAGDVLIIENKLKITYKDPFTKGSVIDHVNNETANGSYNKYMVINIVANST